MAITDTRIAPHNVEAEESTLGSVLINPDALVDVMAIVTPQDFFIIRNGWIFEALLRLHKRRDAIDYQSVVAELDTCGQLEEIGGRAYITSLINNTPTSAHAETYARRVARLALRCRALEAAGKIAELAHETDRELDDVLAEMHGVFMSATEQRGMSDLVPARVLFDNYFDHILYRNANPDEQYGIPTRLVELDKILNGGLVGGKLYTFAGRPGMGKSALLLTMARNIAKYQQKRIAYFTLEMKAGDVVVRDVRDDGNSELLDRLSAMELHIDGNLISQGKLTPAQLTAFQAYSEEWLYGPYANCLHFSDAPGISFNELYAQCMRMRASAGGLDVVMLDYVQLMKTPGFKDDNRVGALSHLTASLKNLSRALRVPVVMAAQLNRNVEARQDKRPILSDLRESGSLEQDSDVVAFIYRDEVYNEESPDAGKAEIGVAKHRGGPLGIATVGYRDIWTEFFNLRAEDTHAQSRRGAGNGYRPSESLRDEPTEPVMQITLADLDTFALIRDGALTEIEAPKKPGDELLGEGVRLHVVTRDRFKRWQANRVAVVKIDGKMHSVAKVRVRDIIDDGENWRVKFLFVGVL